MTLDEASSTLSPLPDILSHGLVAVSTFGLLSFFCSTSLFLYLTYRLISWHVRAEIKSPPNQFLLLIYNLLLADIQQAIAFLLNISSLRNNGIIVGTPTCWAQGWFVSTGDLASSVFICAIAGHTFASVIKEYRLPAGAFYCSIGGAWIFVYAMGALGPLMYGDDFYVRASAWCWINEAYSIERLWLHYFWIFLAMFLTIVIYVGVFIFLHTAPHSSTAHKHRTELVHHGATPLMILYPLIYTVCTAPLAAGRIFAIAGHDVPLGFFVAAGTMIACNGWLDVLLYASTRSDIVFSENPPGENTGLETFAFLGKGGRNLGTVTTIEAGLPERSRSFSGSFRSRFGGGGGSNGSQEALYGMGEIGVKGEVTVTVDEGPMTPVGRDGRQVRNLQSRGSERSLEDGKSFRSGKGYDTWG
ncbi:G protein-coupled glucose receptor regulating Gpa2-domain-containing protein [Leptodontidium sp. 2 PMI_412]|nr:G protein-coupled glucose receptor regulating Gpa2-domain-containing protein [Leptodontidium sp. 2 PMI_412]